MAANTIPAVGSESVLLIIAGLQICLQFDRVGVSLLYSFSSKKKKIGVFFSLVDLISNVDD